MQNSGISGKARLNSAKCTFRVLLIVLFMQGTVQAQNVNFEWAKQVGGKDFETGQRIKVDAEGNSYISGLFSDTADFDPGTGVYNMIPGNDNANFLMKLDTAGDFVWAIQLGGSVYGAPFVMDFELDNLGNIFVVSGFRDIADFDPGPGTLYLTSQGSDMFIAKLDTAGNLYWVKQFNAQQSALIGTDIDFGNSGDLYVSGMFSNPVDFDPGPGVVTLSPTGIQDGFILKLDSAAGFVWANSMSGSVFVQCLAISLDAAENVYATGRFQGNADFDPGPGTSYLLSAAVNSNDAFITKWNMSGIYIWAKRIGDVNNDEAFAITTTAAGAVYVSGKFSGTVDFDPSAATYNLTSSTVSIGNSAVFIVSLSTAGNFIWAKTVGGGYSGSESVSLCLDSDNYIYTTGHFFSTVDFDPGPATYNLSSNPYSDVYVLKLKPNGDLSWVVQMEGPVYNDGAYDVLVTGAGDIYTTGYFKSTVDFDPGPGIFNMNSQVSYNGFVHKMSPACLNSYATINPVSCGSYIAPGGSQSWSSGGTYYDYIPNGTGCDSIITINLTVTTVDTMVIPAGSLLISNASTAMAWQWVDCNSGYSPIPGETNYFFQATVNGSYAVVVTLPGGCSDTSACYIITTIDLAEIAGSDNIFLVPNPATGQFTMHLPEAINSQSLTVTLTDFTGHVIRKETPGLSPELTVSVSDLDAGVYFVQLEGENFVEVKRLVVIK